MKVDQNAKSKDSTISFSESKKPQEPTINDRYVEEQAVGYTKTKSV